MAYYHAVEYLIPYTISQCIYTIVHQTILFYCSKFAKAGHHCSQSSKALSANCKRFIGFLVHFGAQGILPPSHPSPWGCSWCPLFLVFQSKLEFPKEIVEEAANKKVELAGYKIHAGPEQLRKPRIVRIGAVQHKIILPTTAPIAEQVSGAPMLTHGCSQHEFFSFLCGFLVGSNSFPDGWNCQDCQSVWC